MKIFIDSADPIEVKTAWDWGIIDGVTTNPSLAAKVGRPYSEIVREILDIVDGPVSLEVIATTYDEMLEQARSLSKLHENVVVKIPCITEGLRVVNQLSSEGIKTNVTLIFSEAQALLAAKVGATYCSPFLGRVDDISNHGGDKLVERIRQIYDNYGFETQILAASIRDVSHAEEMAVIGADVSTIPFPIIEKMIGHKLTDSGLKKFLEDWDKANLKLPI
jgi:transaldolase